MTFEPVANRVFSHVGTDEVVPVFDQVDELRIWNQGKFLSCHQNHDQHQCQDDYHPQHVLRDRTEHESGVERLRQMLGAELELLESVHEATLSSSYPYPCCEEAPSKCRMQKL